MTAPRVRDYLDAIASDGAALAVAAEVALEREIPPCPGWTGADLLRHTGRVHRWCEQMVRLHSTEHISVRDLPLPDDASAATWFRDGLEQLLATLREADPAAPVWTFSPTADTVSFWYRRMAHETAVHRWDAQQATGRTVPIPADLATDGIDELLHLQWKVGGSGSLTGDGESLRILTTDADGRWLVRLGGGAPTVLTGGAPDLDADATVAGRASPLYLALWNRLPLDTLTWSGDGADSWRSRLSELAF